MAVEGRYETGKLPHNKPSTIGLEFASKTVLMRDGKTMVKAQIWDTGRDQLRFTHGI